MKLFGRKRVSDEELRAQVLDDLAKELGYQELEERRLGRGMRPEYGHAGTTFFQGIIADEDYNADFATVERAVRIYDKMWRADGQVAAAIRVLELPLLRADWSVKAASDDPKDVEVAQFVWDNLNGGMERSWEETLEFILTLYRYGFSLLEKVWTLSPDGYIRYKKLAPRLARTVYRWYPTPDDRLDRVIQRVYRIRALPGEVETTTGGSTYKTLAPTPSQGLGDIKFGVGTYEYPTIPGRKLAHFTIKREGNNFMGVSVLRHAYKHWFYKDGFYRIDAIGNERQALGVPAMEEPQGVSQEDRDRAAEAMAALHAHEKGYVMVPFGWKFAFANMGARSIKEIMPSIEHHDLMISRSVLAQFLNLMQGGSYALSKDESTFFLQAQRAMAKILIGQLNRQIVQPLVDMNFNVDRYPTMEVDHLDKRSIAELLNTLPSLATAGLITPDPSVENALRVLIGLPDLQASAEAGGEVTVDRDSQAPSDDGDPDSSVGGVELSIGDIGSEHNRRMTLIFYVCIWH
ncbi:hypothetical protein LCGC14_1500960 [marine sediment metagenome]|uniref:Portal protein n=1 Tax=marine sediment metagenome TaxID=412755 RepID=A0A0F9J430_9ZZZZ